MDTSLQHEQSQRAEQFPLEEVVRKVDQKQGEILMTSNTEKRWQSSRVMIKKKGKEIIRWIIKMFVDQ